MTWRGPSTNGTPAGRRRTQQYRSAEHRAERARRVAAATPLTPCGYCGYPLGPDPSRWHVPHDPSRRYLPGLWHASCNQREAAQRGARITNAKRKQRVVKAMPYRW